VPLPLTGQRWPKYSDHVPQVASSLIPRCLAAVRCLEVEW
jgi:hypothetical protein